MAKENDAPRRKIKHLGVDEDKPMNDLVEEALRYFLKKYRDKRKEQRCLMRRS